MRWCEECGLRSSKDNVCTNCGLVFEDRPIVNKLPPKSLFHETRVFNSKVLSKLTRNTKIDLKECKNRELRRALTNSQKFLSKDWKHKRNVIVKNEIKRIVGLLNGGRDLYISSFYRYKKISNDNLFKGYSMETIAQSIVLLEIKLEKLPYTLNDFENLGCNRKEIKDYYTKLLKEIDFRIQQPEPKIFINKIINSLCFSERQKSIIGFSCVNLLKNIKKLGLIQTNPIVECGACIYIITLTPQKNICEIIGCSDKPLRRKLYEIKELVKKIRVFGVSDYNFAILENEYTPFANNVSKYLEIDKFLAKCLINYEMNYEKDRFRAVFTCSS